MGEQSDKGQPFGISERVEPDDHPLMPCRRLITIGAEDPVPPWKIETEIAIVLFDHHRVVNTMHFRCDNEETKSPVKGERKADVAVVEHAGCVEKDFENNDS